MLYYILFIVITAVLAIAATLTKLMKLHAAVLFALFGFMVFMTLGFAAFILVAVCFLIVFGSRFALFAVDRKSYLISFGSEPLTFTAALSAVGIPAALLLVVYVGNSRIQGMQYNFGCFKAAFWGSFGAAFAVSASTVGGAMMGGSFNPITRNKCNAGDKGALSLFGAICAVVAAIIPAVAYFRFSATLAGGIISGIAAIIGYAVNLFVGALLSSAESPENAEAAAQTENASETAPDPFVARIDSLAEAETDAKEQTDVEAKTEAATEQTAANITVEPEPEVQTAANETADKEIEVTADEAQNQAAKEKPSLFDKNQLRLVSVFTAAITALLAFLIFG